MVRIVKRKGKSFFSKKIALRIFQDTADKF